MRRRPLHMKQLPELVGWYGVVAILSAYALVSFELIPFNGFVYHFLNATGAIGIIVDALAQKNYQPAVLNIVWLIIAVLSLVRLAF